MSKQEMAKYDKVMVSDDGGSTWFVGEVANIEGERITVWFRNPNSGDGWINIYDINDKHFEITVVEKREELVE